MKILHCCDTISVGGGIASFVNNLSLEQSVQHDVTVGVISYKENENRLYFPDNIEIVDFKKTTQGFSLIYPLKVFGYLLRHRYDVVHIHSSFLYYLLPILFLNSRIKFIYTIHSDAEKENHSIWDKRFWKLKKWCFNRNLIIPVTISPNSKKSFDHLYQMNSSMVVNGIKPIDRKRVTHILDQFKLSDNTKLFLHAGRITEAKNQVVLCEAMSQLIEEGHDVVLVIAGVIQDVEIYKEIENFIGNRIHYIGERNDVGDLLKEVDAMCLSSIWEGLPIILLESLSVGCVPICTPVGGMPNVIHDAENGILAVSTNVTDYKNALLRFLKMNDSEVKLMRDKALVSFKEYDIQFTASHYLDLYCNN